MAYVQRPIPRVRSFVPPGIAMRRPTYPRMGGRHLNGVRLGASPVQSLATSAPGIAGSVGATAAGIGAGTALGIAIPVVGIVLGAVIASLFAAHAARVKGATTENTVLNSLLPTVQQAISAVFSAANAGTATAAEAITQLQSIQQQYWQYVAQVETGPGQAGGPSKCVAQTLAPNAGTTCDKSCTASCCIGCNVINEWIFKATQIFQNNGKDPTTIPWSPIVGNKYGLTSSASPSWSYTPPAAGAVGSASTAVSDLTSLASGTLFGLPIWGVGLAAAFGIWMVTR
jgi:hypothetical protein